MSTSPDLLVDVRPDGVATVTMNRPDRHNALGGELIAALTDALVRLGGETRVRAVVVAGAGKSFSAGADLAWMRRMAELGRDENLADARALANLMRTLDGLPQPTVARVQGAAIGGGAGLVACCDIAVAAREATFCFSEVRLGLVPAVISPYVVRAMGARAARRHFLAAERFGAEEALRCGLVHRVVPLADLDAAVETQLASLREGSPEALRAAKNLVAAVAGAPLDEALIEATAQRIADQRASQAGREGVAAFLGKRRPDWTG